MLLAAGAPCQTSAARGSPRRIMGRTPGGARADVVGGSEPC